MFLDALLIVLGFIGLVWGADKFVVGASAAAHRMGVSPLMIGMTIVAFGTSAPEIFSSAASVFVGVPELAVGNAIGSNIFNIGMALGVAAIVTPLQPPRSLLRRELPALMGVTLLIGLLFANYRVGQGDAIVLISLTVFFGVRLYRSKASAEDLTDLDEAPLHPMSASRSWLLLALGLVVLIGSAEVLVHAAVNIAEALGVPSGVIGLTLIAMGTSLPEMATSIACALKGHHALAIGNIVGSNILNILTVLPFPGLFAPHAISPDLFTRDYLVMLILTVLLVLFCGLAIRRQGAISRAQGIVLASIYGGWLGVMLASL